MKGFKSDLLEVEIPAGMGSDLQIELYGDASTRYLISSVFLSDGKILVSDSPEGIVTTSFVKLEDLGPIGAFADPSSAFAYNSAIRSLPGYEPGTNSLLIPARYLDSKKSLKMFVQFRSDKSTERHKIETKIVARKTIKKNEPTEVNLNVFVADGINLPEASLPIQELVNRLNYIYASAGIQFKIGFYKRIDKKFRDLTLSNNTSKIFSEVSTDAPTGLNLVFSSSISDSYGNLGGLCIDMPGASSAQGLKSTGILLAISSLPNLLDSQQISYWVVELGNNLAHEVGHFFGLNHTFESTSEKLVDAIADTPETESSNLMNPYPVRNEILSLSPTQIRDVLSHPLVVPKAK
ncbi:MAG: hypothetical protein B7Y39_16300 [Bdellovibrio sp. 28-41-41]|nr:MAG: hypothetical protein B7Y39_16300 [Bdellovibrio sp. 28-41-41]